MGKIIWQLPVKQSNFTDHDWIHHWAKYHAFVNDKSLCNKYLQDTGFFQTSIEESKLMLNVKLACQKCLKKANETK